MALLSLRSILPLAAVAAVALTAVARAPRVADSDRAKADYYFMEAARLKALGHEDGQNSLLERAYGLDPDPEDITAFIVGYGRLRRAGNDSTAFFSALEMIDSYVRANPADVYSGYNLASVYSNLGIDDRALAIYRTLDSINPDRLGVNMAYADQLVKMHRFDDAVALYRRVERREGRNAQSAGRIAGIMMLKGDTLGALAEVDSAVSAMPAGIDALLSAASVYMAADSVDRALALVDRARSVDPANGLPYFMRARIYSAMGDTAAFNSALSGALAHDEVELQDKVGMLGSFIRTHSQDPAMMLRAKEMLASLLEQYPHEAELRNFAASVYVSTGDFGLAAEQIGYALDIDPSHPEQWDAYVRLLATAEDYDRAISAAAKAISLYPDRMDFYELAGGIAGMDGRYDYAVETFGRALEIPSASPAELSRIHSDLADVLQKTAATDSAIAHYEQAISLNPDNYLALNNYAYMLSNLEGANLLRAKEMIAKVMLLAPASPTYLDTYAWIYYRLGDYEQARNYIDTAILKLQTDKPDDTESMSELMLHAGDIYYRLGLVDKALELWQRALDLVPDSPDLLRRIKENKITDTE